MLAYLPSPSRGVWDLGPIPLRAYAVCIIIGIIVAIWIGERRWVARGGSSGAVLDIAMFAVPFGLVGGRLYHVATDWKTYFGAGGDPMAAFRIWEGGLGIWGAVLLGGVGAWIGCRVYRIPLPAFADAIAPAILLAQAIGRLGNYFNQELYGRATSMPLGLKIYERYDADGRVDNLNGVSTGVVEKIVHPTFLYEMLWNILIVVVLVQLDRRYRIGHGRLFAMYVVGYCFGRFFVELMRDDFATHVFGVRINVFTSVLVGLCALAYAVLATKGRETPDELQPADRPWPWERSERGAATSAVAVEDDTAAVDATAETEPAELGPAAVEPDSAEPDSAETGSAETGSAGQDSTATATATAVKAGKTEADKGSTSGDSA